MKQSWKLIVRSFLWLDRHERVSITICLLIFLSPAYVPVSLMIGGYLREPVQVTIENGKITKMYFPSDKVRVYPWPKSSGFSINKDEETTQYWQSWVKEIIQHQASPSRCDVTRRKVTVIEKIGGFTRQTNWGRFLEKNPRFVIQ
jgi:hypothetical protein